MHHPAALGIAHMQGEDDAAQCADLVVSAIAVLKWQGQLDAARTVSLMYVR